MNGKIVFKSISRRPNETTMVGHLDDCWQGLENCSNKARTDSSEHINLSTCLQLLIHFKLVTILLIITKMCRS